MDVFIYDFLLPLFPQEQYSPAEETPVETDVKVPETLSNNPETLLDTLVNTPEREIPAKNLIPEVPLRLPEREIPQQIPKHKSWKLKEMELQPVIRDPLTQEIMMREATMAKAAIYLPPPPLQEVLKSVHH